MIAQPRTARRAGTGGQDPDTRVNEPVAFDSVHSGTGPTLQEVQPRLDKAMCV